MTQKHTDEPATFPLEAKQGNACGEQHTPVGVLAALDQIGEPAQDIPCDPSSGSGLIVSAEMVNRAQTMGS